MKRMRDILTAALVGALLLGAAPAALAADEPEGKEEVVYINLDASGAVDTVDVVNIFALDQAGQIVDHGDYGSVRNMTGTEPLQLRDGTVTVQAEPGRLYYEGRLEEAEIPWNVSLRYFLDGEERQASALAGASGELEIRMTVEKNPACQGTFFEDYALQASFTLDGSRCAHIDAPGATAANVGGDRQLTYTLLPGAGADVSIRAQVTDFEMEPVSINGVRLALDIPLGDGDQADALTGLTEAAAELDDGAGQLSQGLSALQEQVDGQLVQGAAQVAAGAEELATGAGSLQTGGGQVKAGADSVKTAAGELDAGLAELSGSISQLQTGLGTLNDQSAAVTGGSGETLAALQTLQQSVDQLAAAYPELAGQLKAGVDALTESYAALDAGLQTYVQGVSDAYTGSAALAAGSAALAEGSGALAEGADQLAGGADQLAGGIDQLADDIGALSQGAEALSGGAAQLSEGVGALDAGAAELKEGTGALREQSDGMGGQLDGLLSGLTGGGEAPASFVSPENRSVASVQFVLRTPAIEKPAPETSEPEPEQPLTFWEKLTALF